MKERENRIYTEEVKFIDFLKQRNLTILIQNFKSDYSASPKKKIRILYFYKVKLGLNIL